MLTTPWKEPVDRSRNQNHTEAASDGQTQRPAKNSAHDPDEYLPIAHGVSEPFRIEEIDARSVRVGPFTPDAM